MPTSTFFRLPEEKRQRLLHAAWTEFTQTPFVNVSINRIIQEAQISRGSFYQYFEDKNDLFQYLMGQVRGYFTSTMEEILAESHGDLFAVPVGAFDRFLQRDGNPDLFLDRCIRILRINPGMDFGHLCTDHPGHLPEELVERVDRARMRRQDLAYLNQVFHMLVGALAVAVAETLKAPDQWEQQRHALEERVEIVKYGSLLPEPVGLCT